MKLTIEVIENGYLITEKTKNLRYVFYDTDPKEFLEFIAGVFEIENEVKVSLINESK